MGQRRRYLKRVSRLIKLRLVGAGGFEHVGITSIGFISSAMKIMGK